MGRPQIASHHLIAKIYAVGGKDICQAIIRHFGQPPSRHIGLDLTTIDASDLHRNISQRRHLGEAGLGRAAIARQHVAEIDMIRAKAMPVVAVTAAV